MRTGLLAALVLGLVGATPALAQDAFRSTAPLDSRIRVLRYDPDQVVELRLAFGFQTMIRFGDDERVENVSIGDGQAWQVTPNKAATLLFVKPVDIATRTNMTVVTDRRSYLFELSASSRLPYGAEPPYVVRFTYPAPPRAAAPPAGPAIPPLDRRNTAYSYKGSSTNLPSAVFDDGRFTYFRWPEAAEVPALFMVQPNGSETLVNYVVRDGYEVVEQTAPRFVLRDGKEATTVINDRWRPPAPSPDAPRPADAKTARAAERAAQKGAP
jgi:type IV secretion system protein VirB9